MPVLANSVRSTRRIGTLRFNTVRPVIVRAEQYPWERLPDWLHAALLKPPDEIYPDVDPSPPVIVYKVQTDELAGRLMVRPWLVYEAAR